MTISRSKEKLLDDLGDLSQCEMDEFENSVEDGNDAAARSVLRMHTGSKFTEDDATVLIEEVRRRIKDDREKNPVLVAVHDVLVDRLTPRFLRDDVDLLIDVLRLHDAPRPLGRHDRTGLLWRRDVLMAWLKNQKPHPERHKKAAKS